MTATKQKTYTAAQIRHMFGWKAPRLLRLTSQGLFPAPDTIARGIPIWHDETIRKWLFSRLKVTETLRVDLSNGE